MKAVLLALLLGCLAFISSQAAAQCTDEACIRAATTLANVNTQQSELIDTTLNSLLGTGHSVDLTVADHNGLASTNIKLGDLTAALNVQGVGTDASTALSSSASLSKILTAASNAARAKGNTVAADAFDLLKSQTSVVNTASIKLGDLISADTRSGPLASAQINALDLLSGTASLFNSKNVASVNQLSLLGSQLGLGPSIANVQVALVVIQPAVFVCGPAGTVFYAANVRVRARVQLTGSGLDLTIPGLTSVRLNLVSLDLVAIVGRASGTIQSINALAGALTVTATPGLAELYLGTISDANFLDRTTPINPATELSGAIIASLTLKLLGLTASASVTARAFAIGTTPTAKTLNFTGPYPQTLTATTQTGFLGNLVDTLLSNLTVTIGEIQPSLGIVGGLLTTLLNDLLTTVTSALTSTSGILKPLLDQVAGNVLDPLLSGLGVKLGEVSVTADAPYKVSAGSVCNDNLFCTTADVCGVNGVCSGTALSCSDGLSCTNDVCDEVHDVCTNPLGNACLINGVCVAGGSNDPGNDCRACTPAASTTSWTLKSAGVACNDGQFCTSGDVCTGLGSCVGLPLSCTDGLPCTIDTCDETNDRCSSLISLGCAIGGACVATNSDEPGNPCRSCNPALSSTSYSNKTVGATCDDGLFCTVGDACNGSGVCASAARSCEDGISCTSNTCDELADVCTSNVSGSCLIGGACIPAGADEPGNPCRSCNPALSTSAYSNKSSGTSCDDGQYCTTGDTCNGTGSCSGAARVCAPGGGCSNVCDEAQDLCRTDLVGCLIAGTCIPPGSDDPGNSCRSCVPAVSSTSWTNKGNGTSCNDGLYCTAIDSCNGSGACVGSARNCADSLSCTTDSCDETNDRCNASLSGGCLIGGLCVSAGADEPGNPCRSCNPAQSTTAYSNKTTGTSCDDGQFCTTADRCTAGSCGGTARVCDPSGQGCSSVCDEAADVCKTDVAGCLIGSACVMPGSDDPSNPCRSCVPAVSTTSWTNKSNGTSCNDGQFCTTSDSCSTGVCTGAARVCDPTGQGCASACDENADLCKVSVAGCLIGGSCIPPGADDPTNPCRSCVPSSSTTAYTNKASGSTCTDGLFCTSGDVCNGSGSCAGSTRDCGDALACTSDSCDETLDRCSSTITTGCVIGNACIPPGANDPTNACRSCNPLLSSTAYSNKTAGASCADGLFCTVGDACDGQGSCGSTARNCEDGISCTSNACDEAADQCTSNISAGCLIDGACRLAGSDDPSNPCRSCAPGISTTSWSNKTQGAGCADGLYCTTNDICNGNGACIGTPRVCDPSGQGCSSTCDESADSCVTGMQGCLIAGACIAPNTDDPSNGCRSCVPSVSTVAWTNKVSGSDCSDGLYCTSGDVCNGTGSCLGSSRDCSDTIACTTDSCDEAADRCTSTLAGGGCLIDGSCVGAGAPDPTSACRSCNPQLSSNHWSNKNAGVSCDDGLFCTTVDRCDGEGSCTGSARDCNGGASGCASVCDESADACRTDVASCVIDGVCRAAGTVDPHNTCRECNPALAPADWSNKAVGSSCDDGLYCSENESCNAEGECKGTAVSCGGGAGSCASICDEGADTCTAGLAGCNIDGVCHASGATDPSNPCRTCNPMLSASSWSLRSEGSSCSDGLFCTTGDACSVLGVCTGRVLGCSDGLDCTSDFCDETADRCTSTTNSGCLINGACQAAGVSDPGNACRSCNPAISTSSWSNKPAAVSCDDGLFCTVSDGCDGQGSCAGNLRSCGDGVGCSSFCDENTDECRTDVAGCSIGEVCLAAGTDDPSNACRTCNPAASTTSWSLKPVGTPCDDGLFCTSADSCNNGGACVGGSTESCSDNQSCTFDACDESARACTHTSASSCVIDGACVPAGSASPGSPCRVCDPRQSTTNWSNAPANILCDDGQFCTPSDHCDGAGFCIGEGNPCPSDGLACTTESCDEASDVCRANVSTGCAIANQCWDSGAVSPADACLICDPLRSTSAFTYVPKRAGCDSDQDGLLDGYEQNPDGSFLDSDNDGKPNHLDPDDDNDTLLTKNELSDPNRDGAPDDARDLDGDGLSDYLDADDDGDTRGTAIEVSDPDEFGYTDDVDEDGIPNWYDSDTDGDGASDAAENLDGGDSDRDGTPDYLQKDVTPADDDMDGIPSSAECPGGIASCPDSDGDGRPDYNDPDDDNDGVLTKFELKAGVRKDTDGDGLFDHLDVDDDGDGLLTRNEEPDANGDGNPSDARDFDGDGIPDYLDPDDDGDGIPTKQEGGDGNGNGVPDYLEPPELDAGRPQQGPGDPLGPPDAQVDAEVVPTPPNAPEDAGPHYRSGLAGGGGLCSAGGGQTGSSLAAWSLLLAMLAMALRRRQR